MLIRSGEFLIFLRILVYRDRPVSVTKLCSQISHSNRILFSVPKILNQSTQLKLNKNVSKTASKNIEEVGWPHGLKLKTLIKSLLEKIF